MKVTHKEIKLLCCFCEAKDVCYVRSQKEQYEKSGWTTRCILTPNQKKEKVKGEEALV